MAVAVSGFAHALLLWLELPVTDRPTTTRAPAHAAIELVELPPAQPGTTEPPSPTHEPDPLPTEADPGSRPDGRWTRARIGGAGAAEASTRGDVAALPLQGLRGLGRAKSRDVVVDLSQVALARRKNAPPPPPEPDVDLSSIERNFEDDGNSAPTYRDSGGRFRAELRRDGTVDFGDTPVSYDRERGRVAMEGLAEWIKRAGGQDPYAASKGRLLNRTFDARLEMAKTARAEDIRRALSRLDAELRRIWNDEKTPPAGRRRLLFERWDECEEHDPLSPVGFGVRDEDHTDRRRRDAGYRARQRITRFIRQHLPRGSEHAYRPDELRSMNARRSSRERFDPYGPGGAG